LFFSVDIMSFYFIWKLLVESTDEQHQCAFFVQWVRLSWRVSQHQFTVEDLFLNFVGKTNNILQQFKFCDYLKNQRRPYFLTTWSVWVFLAGSRSSLRAPSKSSFLRVSILACLSRRCQTLMLPLEKKRDKVSHLSL